MESVNVAAVMAGLLVSFMVSAGLVVTQKWHGALTLDGVSGVQRTHKVPVPRVGGLALVAGYFAAWWLMPAEQAKLMGWVGLALAPALLAGMLDDITQRVGVKARLLATVLSGMVFVMVSGYAVVRVDIAPLDMLLATPVFALVFSGIAIGGISNAINLIDGFNGLAAGTVILALLGFALVALRAGDGDLAGLALVMAAVMGGFFVVNFPFGRLFLGDGGAFLAGVSLAILAVMLPLRNPDVSPFVGLVILGYPVIETLMTALRRGRKARAEWGDSERAHLHHLVHLRWALAVPLTPPVLKNALTSVMLWVLPLSGLVFVALLTPTRGQALAYLAVLAAVYGLWYGVLAHRAQEKPAREGG
ncbi:MAG: glycosyltransferase [Rhodobacteraceae bacterium]|nr:glycosyltransferase [Paracoccaceae bacterium]